MDKRKPAMSIETMLDEVFHKEIDGELLDEIAESQTLIRNFLNKTILDDELWLQLSEPDSIEERKKLLELIAITFLENDSNMFQIDLLTSKQEKE